MFGGGKHDRAHVALFEKRHIAESQSDVTKVTAGASPTAFYLINQLWEDRKKKKKTKRAEATRTHSRAHTHNRQPTKTTVHARTHSRSTQPISYLLADTHTPTQTHASITTSFFFFFLRRK